MLLPLTFLFLLAPFPSFQASISERKNNSTKPTPHTVNLNVPKPVTSTVNVKAKPQTSSSTSKPSNASQILSSSSKPGVAISIQKTSADKTSSSSPITVVITEGCFQKESQKDATNTSKVKETEVSLKPSSPLVMTHRISLESGSCTGGCEVEMAALKERVELLEKEMTTLKKKCVFCSEVQCPNNCSGQGKCEGGKCSCQEGFSGPDCSGASCLSDCNKKGKCVNGKCVCQTGFTGPDCKGVDRKAKVTVETLTLAVSPEVKPGKDDTHSEKPIKASKTIFIKKIDVKDKKVKTTAKDDISKLAIKSSIAKNQQNNTSRNEEILYSPVKQTDLKEASPKQNVTQHSENKPTGTLGRTSQFNMSSTENDRKQIQVVKEAKQKVDKDVNVTRSVEEDKIPSNTTNVKDRVFERKTGREVANATVPTEKDKKSLHANVTPVPKSKPSEKKKVESPTNATSTFSKEKKLRRYNGTIVVKEVTFEKGKVDKQVNVTVSDKKLHRPDVTEESHGKKKAEGKNNATTSAVKDKKLQGNETAKKGKKPVIENDKNLSQGNRTLVKEGQPGRGKAEKHMNVSISTDKEKKVQQGVTPVKNGTSIKTTVNRLLNGITSPDEKDKKSTHHNESKILEKVSSAKKKVGSNVNITTSFDKGTTAPQFNETTDVKERSGPKKHPVRNVNVTLSTEKDKKQQQSNVPTKKQVVQDAQARIPETKPVTEKAKSLVIRSVEVHNITATGFNIIWKAPQGVFKSFIVSRREAAAGSKSEDDTEEKEKSHDTRAEVHSTNRTLAKVHERKVDRRTAKTFTHVLPGSARSYHLKNLHPQTRYSVSLFGSGPSARSKVHQLFISTGPEAPMELQFSNITETSLSVSWTKPKSKVTGFKVTYTSSDKEETGSMSVDSQLSHVLISKLSAGSSYEISVRSVLETIESDLTTATVTTVPDPPTNLQAVNITDTKVLLKWKPAQAKVDNYILSYGSTKSPNVTVTVMLSSKSVEHQLRGLHRSTFYTVKITSQINSLQSRLISTTFTTTSGVKLQAVTPNEVTFDSAVIAWKTPRLAFRSYRLTYQLGPEIKEVILNPTVSRYELTDLVASSNYTVKVDGESEGQYISVASATFTTAQLPYTHPTDCTQVQHNRVRKSGEAEIYPDGKDGEPTWVYCDMETDGGGWTVFQRRADGSTDFFRSWKDYSKGFGNLSAEFWLGNDILHKLTSLTPMTLRIDLRSGNDTAYAHYSNFTVGPEANHYAIGISGYSGTAGDSMRYHNGRPFSTKDKDPNSLSVHCAKEYMGGWWYKNCYKANLNGLYGTFSKNQGVVWIDWKGKDSSLPFTEMKLRPSSQSHITPSAQG